MGFHERRHGGASSEALVREAAALHRRCGDAVIANLRDPARRHKATRVMRHAYTRFCRREVRLAMQRGE